MLNHIDMMGRLVSNPELKQVGDIPVCSFRIACDRDFTAKGNDKPETDFVNVTAWRGTAEFVNKYFTKGRMIVVSGRLQMRDYTDRDGNKRIATEIVADHAYFGDSKNKEAGDAEPPAYQGSDSDFGLPSNFTPDFGDDDLPI